MSVNDLLGSRIALWWIGVYTRTLPESLRVDRRTLARGVRWTDQIRDRALRADVEAILKVLAREAKGGQSERARMDAARPVGADAELEDRR